MEKPMLMYIMIFSFGHFIYTIKSTVENVAIEVEQGDMAVLQCPSNDDQHRFQFWMLNTKDYIGPGSSTHKDKYKYEVLTGTLFIKVFPNVLFILVTVKNV